MENIVTILFEVESEAYQAFSELKRVPVNGCYAISQIGLIKNQNGHPVLLEGFDAGKDGALKGGLLGTMIGILGGPFGVLLGGSMGTMLGIVADADDTAKNLSMLEQVGCK